MEIRHNITHANKVEQWRHDELERMFPEMDADQVAELALGADRFLLEKARRLFDEGCPTPLAYQILR